MSSIIHHSLPPVFVVGAARSGTTLVQSLITALPGFYSCPETHFFDELMVRGPVCGGYQIHRPKPEIFPDKISESHLLESFKKAKAGFLTISGPVKEKLLEKSRANVLTPYEYFFTLMEACTLKVNADRRIRWVEKTPIHISYLKQIFTLFPNAQVVCVQRDSVGILSSAVSTFSVPASIAALDFYKSYKDIKNFLMYHPSLSKQFFFISYDKVQNSDEPLEELLKFLGVENIQLNEWRLEAKNNFLKLYENTAMQNIQPKMGNIPPEKKTIVVWKSKSIEGYASLLNQLFHHPVKIKENFLTKSPLILLAMTADLFFGVLYIARWRANWLIKIFGCLPFFDSERR